MLALALAAGAADPGQAQPAPAGEDVPQFRVDPLWARELPGNWMLGQVSGIDVDADDHVWVLHRPRTLDARQRGRKACAACRPRRSSSSTPDGNVLRSWGGPGDGYEWPDSEHGIHIDHQEHVWIGGNAAGDAHILKFTKDGEFLLQIGRAGQSGGSNDTANLGRPAGIRVDPEANEVYVADGYGNRRVIVFDADTGEYLAPLGRLRRAPRRQPAAGLRPRRRTHPPLPQPRARRRHRPRRARLRGRPHQRPPAGLRQAGDVHQGGVRAPRPPSASGSVSGVTLSEDGEQRWLYIPDGHQQRHLDSRPRETLEVRDRFGRLGKMAGQFYRLHNLAVDSRGNLYTTEVNVGQRVQKFARLGG